MGPAHRARWSLRRGLELALGLLADPALDVLINSEAPFAQLPRTLERLATGPGDVILHRVTYGSRPRGATSRRTPCTASASGIT